MTALIKLAIGISLLSASVMAQAPASEQSTPAVSPKQPAYAQPAGSSAAQAPADAQKAAASAQASANATPKAPAAYPVMSAAAKQRARQMYDYLARGQAAQLFAAFSPEMKKNSPEAKLNALSKQVSAKLGTPEETLAENYMPAMTQPVTLYSRLSKYSKSKVPIAMSVGVNENGQVESIQILPLQDPPPDSYADYTDKTKLHLPFDNTWLVSQGGRRIFENGFMAAEEDLYGVSFTFVKDGRPFDDDGKQNEDFYCFGQPVLAPAAGSIVQMVGNFPDHPPGKGTETVSRGNYVVISHGNSEFSLIPYLKSGSIKVRNGQRVKQGDTIGQCGNSGSSIVPHLEYRLQNTRGFPLPKNLPVQFVDYTADGKPVASGEPVRGQAVANQPKQPAVETAAKPQ